MRQRRADGLFDEIPTFGALCAASSRAALGKRRGSGPAASLANWRQRSWLLERELQAGTWRPGGYVSSQAHRRSGGPVLYVRWQSQSAAPDGRPPRGCRCPRPRAPSRVRRSARRMTGPAAVSVARIEPDSATPVLSPSTAARRPRRLRQHVRRPACFSAVFGHADRMPESIERVRRELGARYTRPLCSHIATRKPPRANPAGDKARHAVHELALRARHPEELADSLISPSSRLGRRPVAHLALGTVTVTTGSTGRRRRAP